MPSRPPRFATLLLVALAAPWQGTSCSQGPTAGPTAVEVMTKVARAYATCRTYQDEGTLMTEFIDPQGKVEKPILADRFTTALVRPARFKFDFRHNGSGVTRQMVVWVDGDGPKNWWDLDDKVVRPESLDFALGGYAGVTMGASTEIPQLLNPSAGKDAPVRVAFSQFKTLKQLDDVKVDDVDCFQVEGRMEALNMQTGKPFQTRSTYAVAKSTFLIRRLRSEMDLEIGRAVTTITYTPKLDEPVDDKALAFHPATDGVKGK